MLIRHLVIATVLGFLLSPVAYAQSYGSLPNENELNRLGLTMSWWSQAAVNPSLDRVNFFTADEQNVYVLSTTGILTTFNGETGRQLWSQLIGAPNQEGFAPTTDDDNLLLGIGMKVYGFKKATGYPNLELELKSAPSASPNEDGKFMYVVTLDGKLIAYDVVMLRSLQKRGLLPQWAGRAELWNYQMPKFSTSIPIPYENEVLFGSDAGFVYRSETPNQIMRFKMETGAPLAAPLAFSKKYIFASDARSRLICLNINKGTTKWVYSSGFPVRIRPLVIGQQVFINVNREGLAVIDIESGLRQWNQPAVTNAIAVSDKHVYANDDNKDLVILDRSNGRILSKLKMRDFSVRVANDRTDRIFMTSPSGTVIAIREIGSDFPNFHLYPERRPILPLLAPEDGAEEPMAEETNS